MAQWSWRPLWWRLSAGWQSGQPPSLRAGGKHQADPMTPNTCVPCCLDALLDSSISALRLRSLPWPSSPWGFSHEARRGSQGASRAAPGKSGLHARGEGERVLALESREQESVVPTCTSGEGGQHPRSAGDQPQGRNCPLATKEPLHDHSSTMIYTVLPKFPVLSWKTI